MRDESALVAWGGTVRMKLSSRNKIRRNVRVRSVAVIAPCVLFVTATVACENVVSRAEESVSANGDGSVTGPGGLPLDPNQPAVPGEDLPFAPLARRLTHLEYQWTLEDLFDLTLSAQELQRIPV
ncbi:MAG: hypothetical protein AAF658_12235, partial [Myxococcota bacterium]